MYSRKVGYDLKKFGLYLWGIFVFFIFPFSSLGASALSVSGINNVIVIILDALRADHLGIYGYYRDTSPHIDRLAGEGLLFNRAIAQSGWTKPVVTSYFTSVYPSIHRALKTTDSFPTSLPTLAEIFRANGYYCYGFIHNINIAPELGFGRGFHVYKWMIDRDIIKNFWLALRGKYIDGDSCNEEDIENLSRFIKENPQLNLVRNGGFEMSGSGWNGTGGYISGEETHFGPSAVHIKAGKETPQDFWHVNQALELDYGVKYIFGAWIKTKNMSSDISVLINELNADKKKFTKSATITGTEGWKLLIGLFESKYCDPGNKTQVFISPGRVRNFQTGEFWIDDVFLIPLEDMPVLSPRRKTFYYLHLLNPHSPYTPDSEYSDLFEISGNTALMDKYDGEIREMDAKLGLLFEAMESIGVMEDSLIILTSDHGEAFGEHGLWTHGAKHFYDEVARVPLIIYSPRLFPKSGVVNEPVEASVGLLPFLVDLFQLEVPKGTSFQGRSYFQSSKSKPAVAVFYECPYKDSPGDDNCYIRTVTDGKWKFISNECYRRIDNFDIRGVYLGDDGTEITVVSDHGKKVFRCLDETGLIDSDFFKSFESAQQAGIRNIFRAADRRKSMLFQIEEDPEEKKDLLDFYPSVANKFQQILRERIVSDMKFKSGKEVISAPRVELNADMKNKLRTLGYLK